MRVIGNGTYFLPLLAVPAAYRSKGAGLNVSRLTLLPALGLLVGFALVAARGDAWWWAGIYGACFVLGSLPGHDAYFGEAIYGV